MKSRHVSAGRRLLRRLASRSALAGLLAMTGVLLTGCTERRQVRLIQQAEEKVSQNQAAEGVEMLKKAVSINPDSRMGVKAVYKLGFTQETYLKDYEGALFNYQEYIRLSQDRVSIYEVLKRVANLYFDQVHDFEKAIASYKKLIHFSPESLELDQFQLRIAQSYFQQNNFDQARLEYQALLDKFPKTQFAARARFEIGNSYYMDGKYDIAIDALKQVLRLHPQSEFANEAQFQVGQCYEQQEKLGDALAAYESLRGRYASPDVLEIRIKDLKKRLKQGAK